MTKHRSVVTGWDPAKVNPDGSTGRPKGVQTAADMRIMSTYDVLAEGIFAKYGVPAITGSPTNSASISKFQAAIAAPSGGFYVVSIDAPENFTINMANVGAVKIYVQQEDYQVDNTKVDSNVVIGVVYGANAIPANSLLLFTTTITAQTSTNGLTFTPAFKYTGAASGLIRVPTQADLANVAVLQTGIRALVTTTGGGGAVGEYFYDGAAWSILTVSNPSLAGLIAGGWQPDPSANTFSSFNSATRIGVIAVPSDATTRYSVGMKWSGTQATGGKKYGFIVAVTATTISVFFSMGITLNNEAITAPFFSFAYMPLGYTGPILIKEGYQSDVTNSERWVYAISAWGVIANNGGSAALSEVVAYGLTFAVAPIVVANTAGDTNTTPAYGGGGNTVEGRLTTKTASQSTTGFAIWIHTGGGNAFGTPGSTFYTWTARGPVA